MIRERCGCGAEIETDGENDYDIVTEWRNDHRCIVPAPEAPGHTSGFALIEQAPDYTRPELHIGFRNDDW